MAMTRTAFSKELVIAEGRALTAITLSGDDAEIITVPVAKGAVAKEVTWKRRPGRSSKASS